MNNQIPNPSQNTVSNNNPPKSCHLLKLYEAYQNLPKNEANELLKGLIYIFNRAREEYGNNVNVFDIDEGAKKVLASLVGSLS